MKEHKVKVRRIGVVGPESAGKTTISHALAAWYGCNWVKEYARSYLSALARPAEEQDLLPIAKSQQQDEESLAVVAERLGHRLLICDTTQLVMRVWGLYQYGRCHSWIEQAYTEEAYCFQLLCAPDLPWAQDPLRSLPNPEERQRVFGMYEDALSQGSCPYVVLRGAHSRRLQQATAAIEAHL